MGKEKFFIVNVSSYYLRDTQVLNPEDDLPDPESEEFCEIYSGDNAWKSIRVDGYLGFYKWDSSDVEGLKKFVASKRGLKPEVLEAFPVE